MSDTRIVKCAKGLLLLLFLATPLFSSFLPECSWNNNVFSNCKEPLSSPKSAAIPSLGFGQFWVNGTQLQENNTLYAQVGDVLHIDIETGTGIPASIPVTFQQIGGASNSFSGGSLTKSGSLADGSVTIDATLENTEIGMYRVSLNAGKGFNFHVNISHAPPLITNITLWDTLYKTEKESVPDRGTYENYRNTNIYANITYKLRSTQLFDDSPVIVMRYHNGTGGQMNVSVPAGWQSQPGTFICQAPLIVTTPNQNNQWRPGDYPLNFTVSYTEALDAFAEINLRILNIPPNITSFSFTPNWLPMPTTIPVNASVKFTVTDPDDDLLYGSGDTSVKMVRDGDLDLSQMGTGVSYVTSGTPKSDIANDDNVNLKLEHAMGSARSAVFQVLLDTTNITNIDATSAKVGMKMQKNLSFVDMGVVEIYNNATRAWVGLWDFSGDTVDTWVYREVGISTPYLNFLAVNGTKSLFVRVRGYHAAADLGILIDWLNMTYNTTTQPSVSGVILTIYSAYIRSSNSLNVTYSYDVTECYDDAFNQWMFNISFQAGLEKGPYSIRVEVYDHGTAPYKPLSAGIDRYAFANYRAVYSAGYAVVSGGLMLGDNTNNNVTKVQVAPRWGTTSTGMTVNRGSQVGLVVEIDDYAFQTSLDEPGGAFPFHSNETDIGRSVGAYTYPPEGPSPPDILTGYLNNTYLASEGAYCNLSLSSGATHSPGMNNFHVKFTLDKYYFVSNEEIYTLTLDIRAGIISGSMTNTIDLGALQVYNLTTQTWSDITTVPQNTKFIKFNTFSDAFAQVISFPEIRQCIHPESREIWFRLQYNESSQANADNYGLNITIDYLRLTVSTYTHQKKAIALLTQDLENFYWFAMTCITGAATHTHWAVTIPTDMLPAGTYDLAIRTQTLYNGVNYNFTGRFATIGEPLHTTMDWQGLNFKNSTLKVNPAGISVAINPAWVNKTVIRAKPAALNLQGTYTVSYGSITFDNKFRLEIRHSLWTSVSSVYKGSTDLQSDIIAFNFADGNWWGNISFAQSSSWQSGLIYFRLWIEANDGAVGVTDWQEMYLIAAPPFVYLEPSFPAVFDVWRQVGTSDYTLINVTDYDTVNFPGAGSAEIILEAQNRTGGLHDQNFSIWTMEYGTQDGSNPNYDLTGTLLVDKDVANKTFDNVTLVARDLDSLWPQVSIVRLTSTFHILNNPPKVLSVVYNTTTTEIFRNHDVNVTIEYQDLDDPQWYNVTVKNYSAKTNLGGVMAFQKQNSDFLWTGTSTLRNATFFFGRINATGAYTANLTLVDPDNAEAVNFTALIVHNNLPVVSSLVMERNSYSESLQYGSPPTFNVKRGDKIGFTVTLRDEEDSYLGTNRVPRVLVRLTHEDPADAVTQFKPKYFALEWKSNGAGGVQTWGNATPLELLRSDTNFGAGTVHVEVLAQDNDGDNNTAYEASGGLPNFIVNNTTPYFIGPHPVSVSATIEYPYLWNITVACGDWEGLYQISITVQGNKENGETAPNQQVAVTASNWIYNASGSSYICSFNVTSYVSQYQLVTLNVTRVTIRDWDYLVVHETSTYGNAWNSQVFNDQQGIVGEEPVPPFCLACVIGAVVAIVAGVCVIYAVFYFRKKLSYRRYM